MIFDKIVSVKALAKSFDSFLFNPDSNCNALSTVSGFFGNVRLPRSFAIVSSLYRFILFFFPLIVSAIANVKKDIKNNKNIIKHKVFVFTEK